MESYPVTCNGEAYSLPAKVLDKIGLFHSLSLVDLEYDWVSPDLDIPLDIFKKIIEWLEYHEKDVADLSGVVRSDDPFEDDKLLPHTGWDKEFINSLGDRAFWKLAQVPKELLASSLGIDHLMKDLDEKKSRIQQDISQL